MSYRKLLSLWSAAITRFLQPQPALALARHRTRRGSPYISRTWAVAGAMALSLVAASAAQEAQSDAAAQATAGEAVPEAVVNFNPNAIMGFEALGDWSVRSELFSPHVNVQLTTQRTQGNAAYSVSDTPALFRLVSRPINSSATALAGAGNKGATLQLDLQIPCGSSLSIFGGKENCSPIKDGVIAAFVSSRSLGLRDVPLGVVSFGKYRPGIYNTITFEIPPHVGAALEDNKFNDLTFEFEIGTLAKAEGAYLFDNLRVNSVELSQSPNGEAPPPGYGGSVNLDVTGNKPVKQTFAINPIQIPSGFHLKKGTAGTTTVGFEAGVDSSTAFNCNYVADTSDHTGESYKLKSCSGDSAAGDLVSANWASLVINGGETTQEVDAQLVLAPLGSRTGSGLLPAMPTFWGNSDTCSPAPVAGTVVTNSTTCSTQTAQANAIITNYFNEVNGAHPTPGLIVAPVPETALRSGDGTPVNNLAVTTKKPGTVNKLTRIKANVTPDTDTNFPFDTGGDLNPGGSFDAYWKLSGNLTPTAVAGTDENLTHFDAAFTSHAVLFGDDVDVVDAKVTADTDSGETTPDSKPATSSGTLGFFVFGEEIPSGGLSFNPSTGFSVDPSFNQEFDLPPIQIWIFDITLGVVVDADLNASGSAALSGADLSVTPSASLGGHIAGGINLGIAEGNVDAQVNLITVSAPMSAQLKWELDTDPAICAATIAGSLKGDVDVSSGGGEVNLDATFGICPFCYSDSYTLFKWGPLATASFNLFNDTLEAPFFSLPAQMCSLPITVSITSPGPGASESAGLPITLTGVAAPTENTVPFTSTYQWTFTPGANASTATLSPSGANGPNPTVTFGAPTSGNSSTWTINLTATTTVHSSGGAVLTQTATATPVTITVTSLSKGVHIGQVTTSNNGPAIPDGNGVLQLGNVPGIISVSGVVAGAPSTPTTVFTVAQCNDDTPACTSPGTPTTLTTTGATTTTPAATWSGFEGGYYLITMSTQSGSSAFGSASAVVFGTVLF